MEQPFFTRHPMRWSGPAIECSSLGCASRSPYSSGRFALRCDHVWTLALLVSVVACASPATTARETTGAEEPPPRFAAGGPEAEAFGATLGYPKGTPATFWRAPSQVGSFSH